jgi:hypothetical protein
MIFDITPPDEPYFRNGRWVRDNSALLRAVFDSAMRRSDGRGFALRQSGQLIGGFVPDRG